MKALKIILSIIAILIGLYLILCIAMPKNYDVSRNIVVNAPIDVVFKQANDFSEMQNWSPWKDYDPNAKLTITGTLGEPGYKYEWSSENKKVGHGSMTRTKTETNKSIENDLKFEDFGTTSNSYWNFENTPEGVKVIWGNKGEMPFLMRAMSPMMEGMMAPDFEKGLDRLKKYAEAHKESAAMASDIKIEEVQVSKMLCLTTRDTASNTTIGMKLGMHYGEIGVVMKKQKLNQAGAPFAIYHDYHENYFDLEPGIPVDKAGKTDGKITYKEMPATKSVVAHYYGKYEDTGKGYNAINAYIKQKGLKINGSPWETYVTDPMTEKDTAKWLTDIYYPVE